MLVRLEHANLAVRDLAGALHFLRAAFPEFRVRGSGRGFGGARWVHCGTDTTYVALHEASEEPPEAWLPYAGKPGLNHLGFEVDDVAALRCARGSPPRAIAKRRFRTSTRTASGSISQTLRATTGSSSSTGAPIPACATTTRSRMSHERDTPEAKSRPQRAGWPPGAYGLAFETVSIEVASPPYRSSRAGSPRKPRVASSCCATTAGPTVRFCGATGSGSRRRCMPRAKTCWRPTSASTAIPAAVARARPWERISRRT